MRYFVYDEACLNVLAHDVTIEQIRKRISRGLLPAIVMIQAENSTDHPEPLLD